MKRLRDFWRRRKAFRLAVYATAGLVVTAAILDRVLDRPLKGIVERRMNEHLVGYTAHVGRSNFHVIGLALVLEGVAVSQNAHPDPPVIDIPRLRMSVHWTDLLVLRVVADATFDDARIHADLEQLQEEHRDPVPISKRGWQLALESIYPLKINELKVRNASVVYQESSGSKPLELSAVELIAKNIRNIRSKHRTYPSSIHGRAKVFEVGTAEIDGHADFLAEPAPGVIGRLDLDRVELSYFQPIADRLGWTVREGFLSGSGAVEWAPPKIQVVDLDFVDITGASLEYKSGGAPTPLAKAAGARVSEVAKTSLNNPQVLVRLRRVAVKDGSLKVVNTAEDPPYHLDFTHADGEIVNVSSLAEDGPAKATLTADFMGSGSMKADATFFPEGKHANVAGKLVIKDTPLASMNALLRAKGKFDVAEGKFDLYSEFRVRDGRVQGYVKPLFRDIEVYESDQDKHKNVFKKMYEGIVGGLAKMLENQRGEVATVTSLDGPLEDPKADAMQALGGLLRNAFAKAILPGFQNEIRRLEPYKYRVAIKKERKAKEREEDEEARPH